MLEPFPLPRTTTCGPIWVTILGHLAVHMTVVQTSSRCAWSLNLSSKLDGNFGRGGRWVLLDRHRHWTRHQSCVLCVVGWSVCPSEHTAERATGTRFIRPCMTHGIDATAALFSPQTTRSARPRPGIPHLWCGKGTGNNCGGLLGLRPRTSPKP